MICLYDILHQDFFDIFMSNIYNIHTLMFSKHIKMLHILIVRNTKYIGMKIRLIVIILLFFGERLQSIDYCHMI